MAGRSAAGPTLSVWVTHPAGQCCPQPQTHTPTHGGQQPCDPITAGHWGGSLKIPWFCNQHLFPELLTVIYKGLVQ